MSTVAPKVKITLPILEEINTFSRLKLRSSRVNEVPCFSDPLIGVRVCNPNVAASPNDDPSKDVVCAIHWICKCYYAGRLGIGLKPTVPHDLEKSKEIAKALSYDQLLVQIQAVIQGSTSPTIDESKEASIAEETVKEKKLLEEAPSEVPQVTKASIPTSSEKSIAEPPPVAKPKVPNGSIHGYLVGSLGYLLLHSIGIGQQQPQSSLWKLAQDKKFKSEPRFLSVLSKLETEGLLKKESDSYARIK